MDLLPLVIQLISGAAGGNLAGKALKNLDLGTVGNSLAGILGGGLGGQLLNLLGAGVSSGGTDLSSIVGSIAAGGAGGGALMAIIGAVKRAVSKA